jgi:hypothetical protein
MIEFESHQVATSLASLTFTLRVRARESWCSPPWRSRGCLTIGARPVSTCPSWNIPPPVTPLDHVCSTSCARRRLGARTVHTERESGRWCSNWQTRDSAWRSSSTAATTSVGGNHPRLRPRRRARGTTTRSSCSPRGLPCRRPAQAFVADRWTPDRGVTAVRWRAGRGEPTVAPACIPRGEHALGGRPSSAARRAGANAGTALRASTTFPSVTG